MVPGNYPRRTSRSQFHESEDLLLRLKVRGFGVHDHPVKIENQRVDRHFRDHRFLVSGESTLYGARLDQCLAGCWFGKPVRA